MTDGPLGDALEEGVVAPVAPRVWRSRLVPAAFMAQPPVVRSLSLIAFCVALGFGIVAPTLPLYAKHFGVSTQAAGAVVSVFAFMRFVTVLPAGRWTNKVGERRLLAAGMLIVAVSSLLAGFAQSYLQLFILRGAGGIGSAMFSVSAGALLIRAVAPENRGQAQGIFTGGFLVGGISGPALGSLVTGISLRAPFFFYFFTLLAAAAVGLRQLPRLEKAEPGAVVIDTETMSFREAWRHSAYRAAIACQLADNFAIMGIRTALVPLFVVEAMHKPSWVTYLGFLVVVAVNGALLLPAGRWSDNHGRKPPMVLGLMICGGGFALLAAQEGVVGYFIAMALIGLGSGMLDVSPGAVTGDLSAGRKAGTPVAVMQMAGDAGSITGPFLGGRLVDSFSYGTAFGVASGMLFGAGLFATTMKETRIKAIGS